MTLRELIPDENIHAEGTDGNRVGEHGQTILVQVPEGPASFEKAA
jgi:hypothetical protein